MQSSESDNPNPPGELLPSTSIRAQKPCVLFLDFDGVAHPELPDADDLFGQLLLIEGVLREFPSVEIVISSSWRLHHDLADLRSNFSFDIAPRVIDVTPLPWTDRDGVKPPGRRQREIEAWLEANRPGGVPWLAIDDRPEWFDADCPNLFLTNSLRGFQPIQVEDLRQTLLQLVGGEE